jgi:hypothetical protein
VPADLADRVANLGGALEFNALLDSMSYGDDLAASLVAVGNIHGQGEVLLDRIRALPTAAPAPPIARPRRHPRRPAVPASPPETAEAAVLSAVRRIREQRSPDSSPTQPLPVVAAASRGSRWR